MKRKAIIIAAAGGPEGGNGLTHLRGVIRDERLWSDHFESLHGGAWNPSEISVLSSPTEGEVRNALSSVRNYDIAYTVFCGHGEVRVDRHGHDHHIVYLGRRFQDEADWDDLMTEARWNVRIYDACRVLSTAMIVEDEEVLKLASSMSNDQVRQLYRKAFEECFPVQRSGGVFEAFGCQRGQMGGDTPQGGAFSYSMVTYAKRWHSRAPSGNILQLNDAVNKANEAKHMRRRGQIAEYFGNRGAWQPPFAVTL